MEQSILTSVKKVLNVSEYTTVYDQDILMHINSVFGTLNQLGIGPSSGFSIDDASAVWGDYVSSLNQLNLVRSYMYLKVRMLFDPPGTSFHLDAIKEQVAEFEWRLNVSREESEWVTGSSDLVIDGGTP